MALLGPLFKELREALLDAFDDGALNDLVIIGLNQRPAVVAAGPDLGARIAKLITWADGQGRIVDLVDAATDAAPGNPRLKAVRPKVMLASGTTEHLGAAMQRDVLSALRGMGLASRPRLDAIGSRLDPMITDLIPPSSNDEVRLRETFQLLNRIPRLGEGSIPLKAWLDAAAILGGPAADVRVVRSATAALAPLESDAPVISQGQLDAVVPKQGEEQIVHQDDMLPFAFLQSGIQAGRSVCLLVVPAYFDGKPMRDITGEPRHSFGSGWLLTGDLLMTNHHVVNARAPGAGDASAPDLQLQARHAVARFDLDAEGATTEDVAIAELVAWAPRGGPLDYAIVRLERPARGRRRLKLVTTEFALDEKDPSRPAVNIIQHPGRQDGAAMTMYKMLACRNNLVFRTDRADLWYFTDTLPGSSGSPVCNDRWQVVALHKRWKEVDNVSFQGKPTALANVGTQIHAILADLASRAELRAIHDEILAAQPRDADT